MEWAGAWQIGNVTATFLSATLDLYTHTHWGTHTHTYDDARTHAGARTHACTYTRASKRTNTHAHTHTTYTCTCQNTPGPRDQSISQ